jgi:hypothetical protein
MMMVVPLMTAAEMTGNRLRRCCLWIFLFCACTAAVQAFDGTADSSIAEAGGGRRIAVNLASRILTVYEGNQKLCMFPVGPGKVSTPSPTGTFAVFSKEMNPEWVDPKDEKKRIPTGAYNPLGYRWLGFYDTYGIHGTNMPGSIGWYVSNGCIRMYEDDVEQVYDLVEIGTPVELYYDRMVLEREEDQSLSYYIYPDGYGLQPLDVASINEVLAVYGIDDFESDEAIAAKIEASDGTPTVIGREYPVYINGKLLEGKAVWQRGVLYLPVKAVAAAVGITIQWDAPSGLLYTPLGQAPGYLKKHHIYCRADDVLQLFYLTGEIHDAQAYSAHLDWHAGLSRAFHSERLYPEGALVPFLKVLYMYIFA